MGLQCGDVLLGEDPGARADLAADAVPRGKTQDPAAVDTEPGRDFRRGEEGFSHADTSRMPMASATACRIAAWIISSSSAMNCPACRSSSVRLVKSDDSANCCATYAMYSMTYAGKVFVASTAAFLSCMNPNVRL